MLFIYHVDVSKEYQQVVLTLDWDFPGIVKWIRTFLEVGWCHAADGRMCQLAVYFTPPNLACRWYATMCL